MRIGRCSTSVSVVIQHQRLAPFAPTILGALAFALAGPANAADVANVIFGVDEVQLAAGGPQTYVDVSFLATVNNDDVNHPAGDGVYFSLAEEDSSDPDDLLFTYGKWCNPDLPNGTNVHVSTFFSIRCSAEKELRSTGPGPVTVTDPDTGQVLCTAGNYLEVPGTPTDPEDSHVVVVKDVADAENHGSLDVLCFDTEFVPALSAWTQLTMALVLVGTGGVLLRGRRPPGPEEARAPNRPG